MTLILGEDEVGQLLDVGESMAALEDAYRDLGRGEAVNRPRSDIYGPHEFGDDTFYVFKSFEGMLPHAGVVALRLNSDVITWSSYAGAIRKDKAPLAPGGRWVGLILLFSTHTGQLLAIMPDGMIQSARVAATNALAARSMARADAKVYGLVGTGQQAGAQLLAMAHALQLTQVRVFSPNASHRAEFSRRYSELTGLDVRAVDSAGNAAQDADILGLATNAVVPVVGAECLRSGMHITCVKRGELDEEILRRADRIIVHTQNEGPRNYFAGIAGRHESVGADPVIARPDTGPDGAPVQETRTSADTPGVDLGVAPVLASLVSGEIAGRADDDEINVFVNNMGAGIQFAALGGLVYRKARDAGIGRELPDDWFSESLHP